MQCPLQRIYTLGTILLMLELVFYYNTLKCYSGTLAVVVLTVQNQKWNQKIGFSTYQSPKTVLKLTFNLNASDKQIFITSKRGLLW